MTSLGAIDSHPHPSSLTPILAFETASRLLPSHLPVIAMFVKAVVSTGLLASAVMGRGLQKRDVRSCGAPEPREDQLAFAAQLAVSEASARKAGDSGLRAAINVETYFHVVSGSESGANAVTVSQTSHERSSQPHPDGV